VIKAGISVRDIAKADCDPDMLLNDIISLSDGTKADTDET